VGLSGLKMLNLSQIREGRDLCGELEFAPSISETPEEQGRGKGNLFPGRRKKKRGDSRYLLISLS
jgi:hypothetical protein